MKENPIGDWNEGLSTKSIRSNAVKSIKLGLQDKQDANFNPDKYLSAIRNIYSGMLLLAKFVLVKRISEDVILNKNDKTINTAEIIKKFKKHNLAFPQKYFDNIRDIRNDIEHKFSLEEANKLDAAIDDAKNFIKDILELLNDSPEDLFKNLWINQTENEIIERYRELNPIEHKSLGLEALKEENPKFEFAFGNLRITNKLEGLKNRGYQIYYTLDHESKTKTKHMATGTTLLFKDNTSTYLPPLYHM